MAPKILTGVGCFLSGASFLVLVVSLLLPIVNGPRTSWEEAAYGFVPGAICTGISFLPMVAGIVWLVMSRKKQPGETSPEGPAE